LDRSPCSWARQCQAVPRLSVHPIKVFVFNQLMLSLDMTVLLLDVKKPDPGSGIGLRWCGRSGGGCGVVLGVSD